MGLHEQFSTEAAWRNKKPEIAQGVDGQAALLSHFHFETGENKNYLPFDKAVEFAKAHQPNLAERSRAISELRTKIASLCSDKFAVKFYTAVDTPLDIYHGVDAFFEYGNRIATVDVSLQEKETKAQVLLVYQMSEKGEVTIEGKELEYVARKVAEILNPESIAKAA